LGRNELSVPPPGWWVRAGENVAKHTQLVGKVAAVLVVSVFLATILIQSWTAAEAATPSTSFCNDSAQLQSWIAQGVQPGIDQYNNGGYPNLQLIQSEATYMEKLAAEAPPTIQPSFFEWANFTKAVEEATAEAVAEGAAAPPGLPSFPALASQIQPAKVAATQVQQWLKTGSGCRQLYVVRNDPQVATSKGGSGISVLWFVGGGFVLLLFLGGILGRRDGGEAARNYFSSARTDSLSAKPRSTYEPMSWQPKKPSPCSRCSNSGYGPGRLQCYACTGRGTRETYHEGIGNTHDQCGQCHGLRSTTCPNCHGSGVAS
jgi:hypothetical protein